MPDSFNNPQYGQPYNPQQNGCGYNDGYQQGPGFPNGYVNGQGRTVSEKAVRASVSRAYGEMTVGLLITAVTAWLCAASGAVYRFVETTGGIGWLIVCIVQIAIAMFLSVRVMRLKPSTARVLFYAYAVLMGFTLSTVFLEFSFGSIALALLLTAGFFLCLTMIGLTTKKDVLKAGPILMVGLIVLIVAELILSFVHASGATMLVTGISLVLFAGMTVYDAQWTRRLFNAYATSDEMVKRVSILAALNLYLDFVNMFIDILQFVGVSRNN
ncbi:MAG: Bax inhibitor-1/YccA family protein [Aeriscardovia sp.]|nr:Bax inhibitor-1/YccA family protein [Aeriscardovia sp.]